MILHKVEPTHQRIKSVGDQRLDERPRCSRNVASRGRSYHITNLFALGYHPGRASSIVEPGSRDWFLPCPHQGPLARSLAALVSAAFAVRITNQSRRLRRKPDPRSHDRRTDTPGLPNSYAAAVVLGIQATQENPLSGRP